MIRTILHYPDKRLRNVGQPLTVAQIKSPEIQKLVDDMAETMYAAPGVGLAATQIGEAYQLFIVDCADEDEPSDLRVFINPVILERHDEITWTEGCLSFPGVNEDVDRAARVKAKAFDRDGKEFTIEADGLLAVAIQHELDHLNGVLMIDHLGALKKRIVDRKMKKRAEAQSSAD
ncbi:MAG TPA: peptide deformylase [Polyangiaceae bacterium]